jgi:hypothetical protein
MAPTAYCDGGQIDNSIYLEKSTKPAIGTWPRAYAETSAIVCRRVEARLIIHQNIIIIRSIIDKIILERYLKKKNNYFRRN